MKKPVEGAAKDYMRRQQNALLASMIGALIGLVIVYAIVVANS